MQDQGSASFQQNPARFIEEFIKARVAESPGNRLFLIDDSAIFDEPLVAFADGDDPLFDEYKKLISPLHMTPREVLERSFSADGEDTKPAIGDIGVICWILPIARRTKISNARRTDWPSLRWGHTREYGERFNDSLRKDVISLLTEKGYLAVAPTRSPLFIPLDAQNEPFRLPVGEPWDHTGVLSSTWSEKHACYAAGLGTFGLHRVLITARGAAHRCGSVVVNLKLPATPRPYGSPFEYCPFFTDKSCSACIDRCPAGCITAQSVDKVQCDRYGHKENGHLREKYKVGRYGCGLCLTGVPCESRIPR